MTTTVAERTSSVQTSRERIEEAAARGRTVLLTTGRRLDQAFVASIESALAKGKALKVISGANHIPPSLGVVGELPEETLRWIAAAELYEELIRPAKCADAISLVVCLDPWAACLVGQTQNPCPDATWVFVSDLAGWKHGRDRESWEEMEDWIRSLPSLITLNVRDIPRANKKEPRPSLLEYHPKDRAAFRSVFADPLETLALGIISSEDHGLAAALSAIAKTTPQARWVVLGGDTGRDRVNYLGPECRDLLPSIASIADVIVLSPGARLPEGAPQDRVIRLSSSDPDSSLPALKAALSGQDVPSSAKSAEMGDYVLYNEWGIGDELLLSAVAREIVRAYPSTRVWIRSRYGFPFPDTARGERRPPFRGKWVETIYQNPVLYGPAQHSPYPGHLVQQMLDKVALDTGLKVQAKDTRPEIVYDRVAPSARDRRSVILHSKPNPRLPSKDWGLNRWTELCEILHREGIRLLQVGDAKDPLLPHTEDLRGTPVYQLPEVVSRAGAVVSLVGFLMHLAEAVRTPAVVIYGGREHPAIDGYPDQVHLSSDPLPCRGRWGCHLAPDLVCPHGMKCMEKITPALVAERALKLLGTEREAGTR